MRHLSPQSERPARGMTLVEVLIAMAIVGVVMAGVTRSFVHQRKITAIHSQRVALIQRAQAAMDLVTRESRTAGTNPTGAAFVPVTYHASQLDIRADLNGNGTTDTTNDPNEHLLYTYDDANKRITRDAGSGAQPLVEHIQAFTFRYLDSAGADTTVSSAIRQLQLTITVRTATKDSTYTANNGYRTFTMTSLIALRN
jgi:prepilin-type N-terminal cleavage/methylation domain-containing protein